MPLSKAVEAALKITGWPEWEEPTGLQWRVRHQPKCLGGWDTPYSLELHKSGLAEPKKCCGDWIHMSGLREKVASALLRVHLEDWLNAKATARGLALYRIRWPEAERTTIEVLDPDERNTRNPPTYRLLAEHVNTLEALALAVVELGKE